MIMDKSLENKIGINDEINVSMNGNCYSSQEWQEYYRSLIDDNLRLKMTMHMSSCSKCMQEYLNCAEIEAVEAPIYITKKVMNRLSQIKTRSRRNILIAYMSAACITLLLSSFGAFNNTADWASKINSSLNSIKNTTDNVSNYMSDNFFRRNSNETKK